MNATARAPLFPLPLLLVAAILATAPWWITRVGLYPYLALEVMIWMIFALGYNLLLGYGGLPSFGHGAFFGVGAYAFGLALKGGLGLWGSAALGIGAAALAGAVVGCFISHRRGIYYALLTIAFGQVFWFLAVKWHTVTGGEDGLLNIHRPALVASDTALHFLALAALVFVVLLLWRLVHSPYGRVLGAIRQNETRAAFVGYNTWLYKWSAFTLSCAIAGVAGALFALAQQSAYPNVMSLHQSGFVVMMVLVGGGLVSFWGPIVGVAFFLLARDLLGAYTETWLLWFGLLFMAMVIFKPDGLAGIWRDTWGAVEAGGGMSALFAAEGLSKRFGDRVVLQDVSFEVAEGELHGIMGPNGAGKTTCFHVLTGRYKPDGGRVLFAGRDVTGLAPRHIARLGIARSFQVMNLFDDYTALENAAIATPEFRAAGFDPFTDAGRPGPARERAAQVLSEVGLAGKESMKAKGLSYGERRALEIGVALAAAPRLLFLDEPTAGLGAQGLGRLTELIASLRGKVTLVVIEHDMRFLFGLADRISVVHWGQVIARGTPAELMANPWVQRSTLVTPGAATAATARGPI